MQTLNLPTSGLIINCIPCIKYATLAHHRRAPISGIFPHPASENINFNIFLALKQ